jgi:hypothetical protein
MGLDAYTVAGFVGAAAVIAAYFANQQGWLPSEDWRFPLANLVGASLILVSLYTAWNFPSAVIEGFWIAISLYGLAKRRPRPDRGRRET